jgi:hypothetical protein
MQRHGLIDQRIEGFSDVGLNVVRGDDDRNFRDRHVVEHLK